MGFALLKNNYLSVKDYLQGEQTSPIRYECIDGEVYAMVGESKAHNLIAINYTVLLRQHLRGKPCQVFMENVKTRIKTATTERYYYPDVQVSCHETSLQSHEETQPKLIIEVLSLSTERRDRADKFYAYRQLDSLEEYVLVAQDEKRVEIYRRATQWNWELHTDENTPIYLNSISLQTSLNEIYKNILIDKAKSEFVED